MTFTPKCVLSATLRETQEALTVVCNVELTRVLLKLSRAAGLVRVREITRDGENEGFFNVIHATSRCVKLTLPHALSFLVSSCLLLN